MNVFKCAGIIALSLCLTQAEEMIVGKTLAFAGGVAVGAGVAGVWAAKKYSKRSSNEKTIAPTEAPWSNDTTPAAADDDSSDANNQTTISPASAPNNETTLPIADDTHDDSVVTHGHDANQGGNTTQSHNATQGHNTTQGHDDTNQHSQYSPLSSANTTIPSENTTVPIIPTEQVRPYQQLPMRESTPKQTDDTLTPTPCVELPIKQEQSPIQSDDKSTPVSSSTENLSPGDVPAVTPSSVL